ncbi:hypothetical protein BYT27DRAFT_6830096 [Phlegmacium glaucopus]|nr:hypothetical protein BYT27DRAFT_6830096 [Phlegmacium glaucopus]
MSVSTPANTSTKPLHANQYQAHAVTPTRQPMQQNQTKPLSSIPAHVRSEIPSSGSTSTRNAMQVDVKEKGPAHPTGLSTPITTPLHIPPQRPNLNPPQYQTDRKVSFADRQHPPQTLELPTAATAASMKAEPKHSTIESEADESFGFNSDDDAFFALADLGPPIDAGGTDTGRPIDNDEGRPIDPDEGLFGGAAAATMIADDVFEQRQRQQKAESSVVSAHKLSRREMIAAALLSIEASNTSDPLQGHRDGDERQASGSGSGSGNPSGSNLTTSGTETGSMAPGMLNKTLLQASVVQQQQQNQNHTSGLNLTSLVQRNHQRHVAQRQNQNQNQNQNPMRSSSSSSNGNESKRPPMQSMGGFHFPPGVNPLQQVNTSTSSSSSSSRGLKRPAETMASNATHTFKTGGGRPAIGMGLQQSISDPAVSTGTREILGRLEVGEGGNMKRVRR